MLLAVLPAVSKVISALKFCALICVSNYSDTTQSLTLLFSMWPRVTSVVLTVSSLFSLLDSQF